MLDVDDWDVMMLVVCDGKLPSPSCCSDVVDVWLLVDGCEMLCPCGESGGMMLRP